jgi:membrane dipeptidase
MRLTEVQQAAGVEFLGRHPTVDVHSHPGRFFLRGVVNPTPRLKAYGEPFEEKVIASMRSGQLSAALFAGVADMQLLDFSPARGLFANREFVRGEAWADYQRQIRVLQALLRQKSIRKGRSVADIRKAHQRDGTAGIFAIEGGDFIEDRLDRVHMARRDGVRSITIVHYHVNQIGDIQTEAPRHGGLTRIGSAIVREMNEAGIIVDLAHAPLSVVKKAVDISRRPMMISHTNLSTAQFDHPRLISPELARLVTRQGGIVGAISWGIGQKSFADWIDSILRLVDVVGVDHTAIGTDMDATFMPVFTDYRLWHLIPAALLAKGLSEADAAKIVGGNFLRVFAENGG